MIVQKSVFRGGESTMFSKKKRGYLVDGVLAMKKVFQKCCTFEGMKTGENLMPVLKDMRRKKVGFFAHPFLWPPVFSYVGISSRQPE